MHIKQMPNPSKKFILTPRNANNLSPTAVEGSFARAMVE
jgi:hypothetical protein